MDPIFREPDAACPECCRHTRSYAGDKLMSSSFDSVRIYYAMDTITGIASSIVLNVTVVTPGRLHMENIVFLRVRGIRFRVFPGRGRVRHQLWL